MMQPTMKLRWLKKWSPNGVATELDDVLILQQWWKGTETVQVGDNTFVFPIGVEAGEWRDIPIEEEK